MFINTKMDFFGLDISDTSLKVVKLKKRGSNIDIVCYGKTRLDPGIVSRGKVKDEDLLVEKIKEVVKEKKLGDYVAVSLPEEKSFFQIIETPLMERKEMQETIEYEAESSIPLSIDDVYLDFQIVSSKENSMDVLVVALPKKIVDPHVSSLKKAGLFPVVAEVESMSTVRSVISKEDSKKSILLIDIGESKTSIIVFSGGVVRFSSYILFSSGQFTKKIADFYNMSFIEAEKIKKEYGIEKEEVMKILEPMLEDVVSVIKKHLHYYDFCGFIPKTIEKIVVCGGGSNLRGLTGFFRDNLNLIVEKGNPLINLSKKSQNLLEEEGLEYTVALGLALRNFIEQ